MDWYAWTGVHNEPELRSLYEWIDQQWNNSSSQVGNITGLVTGGSFILAAIVGVILAKATHTSIHENRWLMLGPMSIAATVSVLTGTFLYVRASASQKAHWRKVGSSRSVVWKLYNARWTGNVADTFGKAASIALNDAAYDSLRCQNALNALVWKQTDANWREIKERAGTAMESAMASLLILIGQGATPDRIEVKKLLADIHETAEEIVKTVDRLESRQEIGGNASDELRQVLGEMKLLNAAHDEVMEIHLKQ